MIVWLLLGVVVASLVVAGVVRVAWLRSLRGIARPLLPADLAGRVAAAADALAAAEVWRPSAADDAPDGAAAIEAALIAGDPARALAVAESAVAAAPDHAAPRRWLAWALVASGEPKAALAELARGPEETDPLGDYVRARAEHLAFEHAAGATGAMPPLVTTADLAIVTLARGRGAGAWIAGGDDRELSATDVRGAIAEHREVTARCLERALAALAAHPGFVEAGYLAARLAVKAGAIVAARRMFDAVAPHVAGRPDAEAFARDRRDLDDPTGAVANAQLAPAPPGAKRARSLRVLK